MKPEGAFTIASPLRVLDPDSRLRLRIFGFKLLFLIPASVLLAIHRGLPLLVALCFFCFWNSIFAGLAALVQRHSYRAVFLTGWDEATAFFGLGLFARLVQFAIA